MNDIIISVAGTAILAALAAFGLLAKVRKILFNLVRTLKSFAKIVYDIKKVDNGQSWEDPVRTAVTSPHGPIQLSNGRVLYLGTLISPDSRIALEETPDEGKTWRVISEIPLPVGVDRDQLKLCEPHLCETDDGKLIALFRSGAHEPRLWQTESDDGGYTWNALHKTTIKGYPPHMIRLHNGQLLLTYGYRMEPYGEKACLSSDGGKSWDVENEIMINPAPNGDLGYPASVELDDGKILTVYYQVDMPGEKPCLMGTIWEI